MHTTLLVLLIIFIASFIRSTFGFGEALIAVPLLALIMPVEVAAPIALLVSMTIATVALIQDWRHVNFRSAWLLFISTCFGIPVGLWILLSIPEQIIKSAIALVIILFSTFFLFKKSKVTIKTEKTAPLFGFLAGILGGAGMNGPPIVAYGALRQWSPQQFRATLQGYFFPTSIVVMFGYWTTRLLVPTVGRYYIVCLPVIICSVFIGRAVNKRINSATFVTCIHSGLIIIGLTLLIQAYFQ